MGLAAGTKLGPYEIQSVLGAGGMGEVYRARDTRLDRIVAVKVLPAHLRQNPEARERFEREARAISALNHPYICHLYDVGEQDGHNFLVMEYLEGETLASRLLRSRLPLDAALRYASEIADALDAAHRRGIVHRDLKPGNTFITAHGECKVLDFGLAKLEEAQTSSDAPTAGMTAPELLTTPGSALGTAAYMSPEQVRGEELDARTDIFSFGVMFYEMLTGTLPFRGKTSGVVAEAILNREPEPVVTLNPEIPSEVERILTKALEKDRDLRYQSAADLRADLKRLQRDSGRKVGPAAHASQQPPESRSLQSDKRFTSWAQAIPAPRIGKATILIAATALVLIGLAATLWWLRSRTRPTAVEPISFARLTEEGEYVSSANISPDGRYVVYESIDNGKHSLWLRQTATSATVRVVPEGDDEYPGTTFSPDNNFIYFLKSNKGEPEKTLYSVPSLGGVPRRILSGIISPVAFSPDGKQIAFARSSGDNTRSSLVIAAADGTGERELLSFDSSRQYPSVGGPSWSPDGTLIALISVHPDAQGFYTTMDLVDLKGNIRTLGPRFLAAERSRVAWMGDGSGLLYTSYPSPISQRLQIFFMSCPEGVISRITNDMDSYGTYSLGVTRDGSTLATIQTADSYHLWAASAASGYRKSEQVIRSPVSGTELIDARAGKVVFVEDGIEGASIWVADLKTGNRVQVSDKGYMPHLSRDGKLVAFSAMDTQAQEHLWLVNSDGSGLHQLTSGNGDHLPIFSPDGRFIYYVHFAGSPNIFKIPAEGGTPVRVADIVGIPLDVSPDGQSLLVAYPDPKTGDRVWATMSAATGKVTQVLPLQGHSAYPLFLPSGDAVAYIETHGGVTNMWKLPLNGGPRVQLTHFDSEEIWDEAVTPEGDLIMVRGHRSATVVLMKNFRPR